MDIYRNFTFAEPLDFSTTRQMRCSYLPGRNERRLVADITRHAHLHDTLALGGFRRVENWIYRPVCASCDACRSMRIASGNGMGAEAGGGEFTLSRGQRRAMRRNADLTRRILPNVASQEHYELFRRYIAARHPTGHMAAMDAAEYADMITVSPIETVLVEYRDARGEVLGIVLTDLQSDGLSMVYSFYDPAREHAARSLGTFMICDLAAITHEMGLPYVYLGYYIAHSPKMNYKAQLATAEILEKGKWVRLRGGDKP